VAPTIFPNSAYFFVASNKSIGNSNRLQNLFGMIKARILPLVLRSVMTVKPASDLKGLLICMQFIGISEQGVALQKQMNFSPHFSPL